MIRRFLPFFILSILAATAQGQIHNYSPYSSFHIGLPEASQSVYDHSFGGAKNNLSNQENINTSNAAANAVANNTLFDLALRTRLNFISESGKSASNQYTHFLYGGLLLPVKEDKWCIGAMLLPYSTVAYQYQQTAYGVDSVLYNYQTQGSGGLQVAKVNSAYRFSPDSIWFISLGLEAQYYFGNIQKSKTWSSEQTNFFGLHQESHQFHQGLGGQVSGIVSRPLAKGGFLSLGARYTPKTRLSSSIDYFSYNFEGSSFNIQDTIDYSDQKLTSSLASVWGIGLGFGFGKILKLHTDFEVHNWNSESINPEGLTLTPVRQWNIGLAFSPNANKNSAFQPSLLVGLNQQNLPFLVQNQMVSVNSIRAGVSLPILGKLKSKTIFNFGTEFGSYSSTVSSYQERYANVYVGLVLSPNAYDKWFKQAKIE